MNVPGRTCPHMPSKMRQGPHRVSLCRYGFEHHCCEIAATNQPAERKGNKGTGKGQFLETVTRQWKKAEINIFRENIHMNIMVSAQEGALRWLLIFFAKSWTVGAHFKKSPGIWLHWCLGSIPISSMSGDSLSPTEGLQGSLEERWLWEKQLQTSLQLSPSE